VPMLPLHSVKRPHLQREAAGPLAAPELLDHQAQHQGRQRAATLKVELVEEVLHRERCSVNKQSSAFGTQCLRMH
jgi:hypothetical protein